MSKFYPVLLPSDAVLESSEKTFSIMANALEAIINAYDGYLESVKNEHMGMCFTGDNGTVWVYSKRQNVPCVETMMLWNTDPCIEGSKPLGFLYTTTGSFDDLDINDRVSFMTYGGQELSVDAGLTVKEIRDMMGEGDMSALLNAFVIMCENSWPVIKENVERRLRYKGEKQSED